MSSSRTDEDKHHHGRMVVDMLGDLQSLPLPEGWIGVNHYSGGIIYLHKKTRVVTWSKPYNIGSVSLRKHDVPAAAIPCLHQAIRLIRNATGDRNFNDGPPLKKSRRLYESSLDIQGLDVGDGESLCNVVAETDIENTDTFITKQHSQDSTSKHFETQLNIPVSTMDNNAQTDIDNRKGLHGYKLVGLQSPIRTFENENIQLIKPEQLSKYLNSIFNFKYLTEEEAQRPIFGEGSREEPKIELPDVLKALPYNAVNKRQTKEHFAHNPGNTHLSMLNEYCKKNLKNPIEWVDYVGDGNQFIVEAVIDGVKYGKGEAKSKKAAKQLAAKKTLEILVPEEMAEICKYSFSGKEFAVFDELEINDPAIADCVKSVGLPLPAEVLLTCLKRNRALCDANIFFKLTPNEGSDLHTYEIICGKHSAMGLCKNRKTGKQLASQAILKKIHPKLVKWGQLIMLYCSNPSGLIRESKKMKVNAEYPKLPEAKKELMVKLKNEMRDLERKKKKSFQSSSTITTSTIIGQDLNI